MRRTAYPAGLLALALALTLAACDAVGPDLADASSPLAARGQERVAVCHYDADAHAFKLITVAAPAVPTLLARGGALPGTNGLDEACRPTGGPVTTVIEDFESGNLDAYTNAGVAVNAVVSQAYAHDGEYGLGITDRPLGTTGWIYRDDAAARVQQGDVLSVWVMFDDFVAGRAYFGFGASSAGTLSFVLAPNSGEILFQENPNFDFIVLNSSPMSFSVDKWYRAEVVWGADGSLVGNVYDSDGTTLLATVSASSTLYSEGGIAFRGFTGVKAFDTVTRTR